MAHESAARAGDRRHFEEAAEVFSNPVRLFLVRHVSLSTPVTPMPSTWEGWVVLAVYLALLVALILLVPADRHPNWFWTGLCTLIASLIAICCWKGELPKWRWG